MRTLHIRIEERHGSGYQVRAHVPGGPEVSTIVPIEDVLRVLQDPPHLGDADLDDKTLEKFGQALHDIVGGAALQPVWAAAATEPARVVLNIRPPELRDLPWELMLDDRQHWVFGNPRQPIARTAFEAFAEPEAPLQLPVRMLVIVGAPDDVDREALGVDRELDAIYDAVRELGCLWQVDVLDGANQDDLRDRVTAFAPHVLHFIGHSTTDEAGRPALEIGRAAQEPKPMTMQFVVNALRTAPPPRLVVLNACRTAEDTPLAARTIVRGLTTAFLELGAAAVVSMQGDVEAQTSVLMSRSFYSALAAGEPVDVAMASAHDKLHWLTELRTGDWALPTLTLRAHPERVLDPPSLEGGRRTLDERAGTFPQLRWLVDRTIDRHRVLVDIAPDGTVAAPPNRHIAFLTGAAQVGKTTVAQSCVLVAWQRGLPVVHVTLPNDTSLNCEGFMRKVVEAVPGCLGTVAAHQASMAFLAALEAVTAAPLSTAGDPTSAVRSLDIRLSAKPTTAGPTMPHYGMWSPGADVRLRPQTPQQLAFERFRQFLVGLAASQPLLIVIDNVGRMDAEELMTLREHLFLPAAKGETAPVRLLIVERPRALDAVLAHERLDGRRIRVEPFAKKDVTRLLAEFCARRRAKYADQDDADWQFIVEGMRELSESVMRGPVNFVIPPELYAWEENFSRKLSQR